MTLSFQTCSALPEGGYGASHAIHVDFYDAGEKYAWATVKRDGHSISSKDGYVVGSERDVYVKRVLNIIKFITWSENVSFVR